MGDQHAGGRARVGAPRSRVLGRAPSIRLVAVLLAAVGLAASGVAGAQNILKLSAIRVRPIRSTSVVVSWRTNERATSQVEYGRTRAYGAKTRLDNNYLTWRSETIRGLAAATSYHFRVRSRDRAGRLAISGDVTFRTVGPATPPPTTTTTTT